MKNVFNQHDVADLINRINKLSPSSQPLWGKMSVDKMLGHCNVTYELVYDNIHPKPGKFKAFILKLLVKPIVVGNKPYAKNSQTSPEFLIKNSRNFETEKARLIQYIKRTQELGEKAFEGKESHSFGPLKASEWNALFYKHLDHHLVQFGV
jgi:hypothetical protein